MPYGIMRIEKRKRTDVAGLQKEANRTKAEHDKGLEFDRSDIDWSLTDSNIQLVHTENWNHAITDRVKGIEAETGKKTRKDAVVLLDSVFTASPEFFEGKSSEETQKYFEKCLAFYIKEFCQNDASRVINAVIHLDETTPHMQVASIPIFSSEVGDRLNAKIIMGSKAAYRQRQDKFFSEVSSRYGLERGEVKDAAETKAHTTKREWQIAQQEETIEKNNDVLQKQREKYIETNKEQNQILQDAKDKIEILSNEALQTIKVNKASGLFNRDTVTLDRTSYESLIKAVDFMQDSVQLILEADRIPEKRREIEKLNAEKAAAQRECIAEQQHLAELKYERAGMQAEYTEMKDYIDTHKDSTSLKLSIENSILEDENSQLKKENGLLKDMFIALMRDIPLPGRWRDRLNKVLNSLSENKDDMSIGTYDEQER